MGNSEQQIDIKAAKVRVSGMLDRLAIEIAAAVVIPREQKCWCGADVVISLPGKYDPESTGFYPSDRAVLTEHAHELTWLFYRLKDIFYSSELVDGGNKYDFFGRLGNAAERCTELNNGRCSAGILLLAVVREAYSILSEIADGEFTVTYLTSANRIADDFIPDGECNGYTGNLEMKEFYSRRGIDAVIN